MINKQMAMNKQMIEAHKAYLTKQNLVEEQRNEYKNIIDTFSDDDTLRNKLFQLDKKFENINWRYKLDWSWWSDKPARFVANPSYDSATLNLDEIAPHEAIEKVNEFYESQKIICDLIEKHQSTINEWESKVDKAKSLRDMLDTMSENNREEFESKIRSLMTTKNQTINLPSVPTFEVVGSQKAGIKWTPSTKWVKARYPDCREWFESLIIGYTIKEKVKKNYLVVLFTNRGEVIKDVLITQKTLDSIINLSLQNFYQDIETSDRLDWYTLDSISERFLYNDIGHLDTMSMLRKVCYDMEKNVGMYSTIGVVYNEQLQCFELSEYADNTWTHTNDFYLKDYGYEKQAA